MPTLYLIDGYAQFFRHYHAIRTPMTSPVTKEPTNMTFGFLGMLLKLLKADGVNLKSAPATHLAVVLDVSGDRGTFRSQIDPNYKANRDAPPEDLAPQVDRCLSMLREVGVPVLGAEGFEADDVIATLVERLRTQHPELDIRIVSKDKDLKQLLSPTGEQPRVELFDVHTDTAFTSETLRTELGLSPSQVVDMLTLTGDKVDNVPGIDGVGEKTAAQLLQEFGSVEAIVARAGEIKGKRGEKIREAIPLLPHTRSLITLRKDAPVDFALTSAEVSTFALARLVPVCKELGFNRYQQEVRALLGEPAAEQAPQGQPASGTRGRQSEPRGADGAAQASSGRTSGPSIWEAQGSLFGTADAPAVRAPQSGAYRAVTTLEDLRAVAARAAAAPVVSVDTETTSLSFLDARLCGISLAFSPGEAFYIPIRSPQAADHLDEAAVLSVLKPLLEDPMLAKCGHNLKYDILVLRRAGVTMRGLTAPGACDSMIASYLIDASRSSHALDALALALLQRTNISITELIGTGKHQRRFDEVDLAQATQYAAEDADVALQLRAVMMPQLQALGLMPLFTSVEMPLVDVLAELEWNGIEVNAAELDRQRARLLSTIDELTASIRRETLAALGRTIDPDSPRQLASALFSSPTDDPPGLGLPPGKRTKTGYSTDAEVLESLAEDPAVTTPLPSLILEYRQLSKLVSTYLVALKEAIHPATGRVHASFHQTVAATGRLSSSDPNLQNIPIRTDVGRDIRRAFVAPVGRVLITADYSQIELRVLAHLSKDPGLIAAFKAGEDIHTAVAAQIHGVSPAQVTKDQRASAKMVNFGIVYGITAFGLARRLGIDEKQAAEIITGYKRRFPGITTFLQECVEQARSRGYVETMLGRRRPIPDANSSTPSRRALAERLAINSVVQGSAADLIKIAMVDLHRRLDDARRGTGDAALSGVLMLLQIHDELVFEGPASSADAAQKAIVARMEAAMALDVPLVADAGHGITWYED